MPITSIKAVRQPAVAGSFYPADRSELTQVIDGYLKNAAESPAVDSAGAKAILVPHAGYVYSGSVAAHAYKVLHGKDVGTVVLMSNAHAAYVQNAVIDGSDEWATPLGNVPVDTELRDRLINRSVRDYPKGVSDAVVPAPTAAESPVVDSAGAIFTVDTQAHAKDHTLEAQLPFLIRTLKQGFKILPLMFGGTDEGVTENIARALARELKDYDLIVVSTDLSHYPEYGDANRIDKKTLDMIADLDSPGFDAHIASTTAEDVPDAETLCCGPDAVKTLIALAKVKGWSASLLKYANSGDSPAGSKDSVVGYGAVVFADSRQQTADNRDEGIDVQQIPPLKPVLSEAEGGVAEGRGLTTGQKNVLLSIAKDAVEEFVKNGKVKDFKITDSRLTEKQGAFVTLKVRGELRGCIGQIIPTEAPLWRVVRDMAIEAASDDPRFPPVGADELDKLEYEVSVLSVPQKIGDWQKIALGKHGVIVRKGGRAGVFLPQVADETGWDLEEFLSQLCSQKAGLAPDCFKNDPEVIIEVFEAEVFNGFGE